MIVPIILMGSSFGFTATSMRYSRTISGLGVATGAIGVAIAFLVAIVMFMALIHMIRNNNFGKAFALGEILDIIKRIGWGKYLLWLTIIFASGIFLSAIGLIPYVGWLISLIIDPLYLVFTARTASLIYSEGAPSQ